MAKCYLCGENKAKQTCWDCKRTYCKECIETDDGSECPICGNTFDDSPLGEEHDQELESMQSRLEEG